MPFTGHEDHTITLQEASEWTANYRATINTGETIAHYFGKDALSAILAQSGCVGFRIYYALDSNSAKQIIAVGVTEDGNDLYNGLLAERTIKCPQQCAAPNPLNS